MYDNFVKTIENIEEDLSRLNASAGLVYDSKFHLDIMRKTNKVSEEILNVDLDSTDKTILLTWIKTIYETALEETERGVSPTK